MSFITIARQLIKYNYENIKYSKYYNLHLRMELLREMSSLSTVL